MIKPHIDPRRRFVWINPESRIYQINNRRAKIERLYFDSWCRLFNTKSYRRSVAHVDALNEHLDWYLTKKFPSMITWRIVKTGNGDLYLLYLLEDEND